MRSGDFVFFVAYALARLVPPLSSFFLTLLEYYGLQLQHLSPNFVVLVVSIGAAVPTLLRIEGCEPAPTTHRRLLLPATDTGPRPFPLAGGSTGEKIGHWCRWTPTTGSHFLPVIQPWTMPIG
jgi:hypothetical protein